jgi:DNA-binding transcriptional MerR regulator
MSEYTETTGELAREGRVTVPTIRLYAALGLLDFVVISNGTRLFRRGQGAVVREIFESRRALRGRKRA